MKRDDVIKQVATVVGHRHQVDLKNYELLILVEIYQVSPEGVCGRHEDWRLSRVAWLRQFYSANRISVA